MRRILLSCAILGAVALPAAAASARAGTSGEGGFFVVRQAANDGGVNGRPVVTLIVHGFVLGSVRGDREARIDVYQIPRKGNGGGPTAVGTNAKPVMWRHLPGREFSGSGFRFRAMGGYYRVVVRGSGVYLFAGGSGNVTLRGSTFDQRGDGTYSIDGSPFRSLPKHVLKRELGGG
jgi:hypothetical protein